MLLKVSTRNKGSLVIPITDYNSHLVLLKKKKKQVVLWLWPLLRQKKNIITPLIIVANKVATKFQSMCQLNIYCFTGTLSVLHVITGRAACIGIITEVWLSEWVARRQKKNILMLVYQYFQSNWTVTSPHTQYYPQMTPSPCWRLRLQTQGYNYQLIYWRGAWRKAEKAKMTAATSKQHKCTGNEVPSEYCVEI